MLGRATRTPPTIAAFQAVFGSLGYEPCETGELAEDCDKMAFYAKERELTRAARQLAIGR